MPYAGSAAPTGWLLCDGSAVSRGTYAGLFAVIGTTYGGGDGSTTFNLPNLKGRYPAGRDSSQGEFDTLGESGGAKTHTLAGSEIPSHSHPIGGSTGGESAGHVHTVDPPAAGTSSDGSHSHNLTGWQYGPDNLGVAFGDHGTTGPVPTGSAGAHSHTVDIGAFNSGSNSGGHTHSLPGATGNTGSGGAHNNLPPYLTMNYLIKH